MSGRLEVAVLEMLMLCNDVMVCRAMTTVGRIEACVMASIMSCFSRSKCMIKNRVYVAVLLNAHSARACSSERVIARSCLSARGQSVALLDSGIGLSEGVESGDMERQIEGGEIRSSGGEHADDRGDPVDEEDCLCTFPVPTSHFELAYHATHRAAMLVILNPKTCGYL
jgi:hypothetical protein